MKNLSWLYYKGYYVGFQYWNNIKPSDKEIEKNIIDFFRRKNDCFTKAVISDFKKVCVPNPKNKNTGFQMITTYPGLLMGSGYSHGIGAIGEFKIGFQLDYVTGLPIIPGSSVKGVIRSVFPIIEKNKSTDKLDFGASKASDKERIKERVKAKWILALLDEIHTPDFLTKTIQPKEIDVEDKIDYFNELIKEIFEGVKNISKDKPEEKYYSVYKRNIFFEAIPVESEHTGKFLYGDDSITPHYPNLLKNPIPLLFLKVLPNIIYDFKFQLNDSKIEPILEKANLRLLFQKILLTIGIGAKTNVGYGQFVLSNSSNKNGSSGLIEEQKKISKNLEDIEKEKSEAEKKLLKDAQIECFVLGKDNKYYTFGVEWDKSLNFKKKIEKVSLNLKPGDKVLIKVIENYIDGSDLKFENNIKMV